MRSSRLGTTCSSAPSDDRRPLGGLTSRWLGGASPFAFHRTIPVPVDYVIGPGDTVYVQLFGNQNTEYFFTVSREGVINFPEIGPVSVSGLDVSELRDMINERVTEQMIGVRASVTLGELRSIRVFVLGDVTQPGSYHGQRSLDDDQRAVRERRRARRSARCATSRSGATA